MRPLALAAFLALATGCTDLPTSSFPGEERGTSAAHGGPLQGADLFVTPGTHAAVQAAAWGGSRPADAALMERLASVPQALWFGDWTADPASAVESATRSSAATGALPVLVAYNIPMRDCGGLSGGGGADPGSYRSWIRSFAGGVAGRAALVVLEPDALAQAGCLTSPEAAERMRLLADAVAVLKQNPQVRVYVDAGHARWLSPAEAARRLREAGIDMADGFSLNVSNFLSDAENIAYGREISRLVGGKGFVIDAGRNGLGPTADLQWCNPAGRALGRLPSVHTGEEGLDAYLWIKTPGESDGACNGGPDAGQWWPEYALDLARRAGW
jgi:endoglucanase